MKKLLFFIIPTALFAVLCLGAGPAAGTGPDRLQIMADSALVYCKAKGMSTDMCILVDMKVHSGRKRMYVWNFNTGGPVLSTLCCHGCGLESTPSEPVFSNTPGSNCTSLGKYRIGARSWSNWGINVHYKLHGLEATNSNAFQRIVVLHAHNPMPEHEIYPLHLPMGWSLGCPVIPNSAMRTLDPLLQATAKPVLLWIYY